MTDPTLARCDDEPWNQPEPRAPTLPSARPFVAPLMSIHERVRRRIPIFSAPGVHAAFVYVAAGDSVNQEPCMDCGDLGFLTSWTELRFVGPKEERPYKPVERAVDLCEACSRALEDLPLGVRWKRAKTRASVLARCIRALEAVGDADAVKALVAIRQGRARSCDDFRSEEVTP